MPRSSARASNAMCNDGPALDERLLAALAHGLPSCAGVALGVERLLMAMLETDDIADVLAFPFRNA